MTYDVVIIGAGAADRCWPAAWRNTKDLRAVAGAGPITDSRPVLAARQSAHPCSLEMEQRKASCVESELRA